MGVTPASGCSAPRHPGRRGVVPAPETKEKDLRGWAVPHREPHIQGGQQGHVRHTGPDILVHLPPTWCVKGEPCGTSDHIGQGTCRGPSHHCRLAHSVCPPVKCCSWLAQFSAGLCIIGAYVWLLIIALFYICVCVYINIYIYLYLYIDKCIMSCIHNYSIIQSISLP